MSDPNVERVIEKHRARAALGIKKYGVTTADAALDRRAWLLHLQEELMDACIYIEAALREKP